MKFDLIIIFHCRFCGVDIQSQAAYDLAVQGPLMTNEKNVPMMYSIKCIDFAPPEFTLGK